MTTQDLTQLTATQLSALIRTRQISPVELTDAVLERIDALNPKLNAFLAVDHDGAHKAAQEAEAAVMRGDNLGPLHGLPVSIKDLEPTNGLRCTYGSKLFENNVAEFDGIVSQRVRAAGGIITGKTNTPNFGHKDMTDNLIGPPCRNPWMLDRTAGGSSGGAAASVAAGLGPLAHGSDGGGSIRIPAALCGLFGIKPSFGRVPMWPNKDIWVARSHNGPITRTVADAALMLSIIAGPDDRDPMSIDHAPDDYLAAVSEPFEALNGLRIAWSADFGYAEVAPEVRALTTKAAARFSDFGCHVEETNPGWDFPGDAAYTSWCVSFAARLGEEYDRNPEWFEPSLVKMIEFGQGVSGVEHANAGTFRTEFFRQAYAFFQPYDLLITPMLPYPAWPVDGYPTNAAGEPVESPFERNPFSYPFNMTGQPAASVPCGFTSDGLPVALQIVGKWHCDTLVLQASAALEQAQPWAEQWPAL